MGSPLEKGAPGLPRVLGAVRLLLTVTCILQVRRVGLREVNGQIWSWNFAANFRPSARPPVPTRPTLAVSPVTGGDTEVQREIVTYQDRESGSPPVQARVH